MYEDYFGEEEIHSLPDFVKNMHSHLRVLSSTKRPEMLMVNGKPEVVVQSIEGYKELLEQLDELQVRLQAAEDLDDGTESPTRNLSKEISAVREEMALPELAS